MNIMKLGCLVPRLLHKNALLQRLLTSQSKSILRLNSSKAAASTDNDDVLNKPIQFSTSEAASWNPVTSRTGELEDDAPECQSYVVLASVAVFLIYFCVLREENEIDQKLTKNLVDHFNERDAEILIQSQQIAIDYAKQRTRKE